MGSLAVVVGSLLLSTWAFAQGCCNCSCQGTSSHMMKQNSCSNHQMMMKHKKMMHKKMMQQKAMMQKNQSENKAEKMMQEGHRLMQAMTTNKQDSGRLRECTKKSGEQSRKK